MIGASKILTVSYGTFSCTLEGFDDSFGTMKAIAEYFRDLASDDRYFGAEPPTPDAEMLAKIAGREIRRQVEAKVEDNGVTLRPLEQPAAVVAPEMPQQAPQPIAKAAPVVAEPIIAEPIVNKAPETETLAAEVADVAAPNVAYDDTQYDDAQDEAQAEFVEPETAAEVDTESVAAKLRRIRAVVAKNQTADAAAPIFSEDQHAVDFLPEDEAADDTAEASAETVDPTETADPIVEVTEDAIAEVSEFEDEDTDFEDEGTDTETDADTDISALMSRVSSEAADDVSADTQDDAETIATDFEDEYDAEDDAVSNILDAVAKDSQDDVEIEVADDAHKAEADDDDEIIVDQAEDQQEASSEDNVDAKADTQPEAVQIDAPQEPIQSVRPSRVRVLKVKKADIEAHADTLEAESKEPNETLAADDVVEDMPPLAQPTDGLGETNLSAEDEAELLAELADVELDAPVETDTGISTALRSERTNRALHDEGGAENEASVTRLLDETNAKLGTEESTRRRSAISHLRAAVAATVADRKFTKSDKQETPDDADAYRTDLADVIRPHHATAKGGVDRPAPLILVSEQRIDRSDLPAASDAGPIRPRRIVKSDLTVHEAGPHLGLADLSAGSDEQNSDDKEANIFADSTSFADFAEKMGASELPDLLEAAAAYTAYVEGRPHFARPQIMRQVAGFAGKEEFNREEGLRSFGQLLRQGKIIKIKRGQFEIAQTTRFKPEARFAGE